MSSTLRQKKDQPTTSISHIIPPGSDGYITVTAAQFQLLRKLNLLKQIGTSQVGSKFDPFFGREAPPVTVYGRPISPQALMFQCYLIDPPLEDMERETT